MKLDHYDFIRRLKEEVRIRVFAKISAAISGLQLLNFRQHEENLAPILAKMINPFPKHSYLQAYRIYSNYL